MEDAVRFFRYQEMQHVRSLSLSRQRTYAQRIYRHEKKLWRRMMGLLLCGNGSMYGWVELV